MLRYGFLALIAVGAVGSITTHWHLDWGDWRNIWLTIIGAGVITEIAALIRGAGTLSRLIWTLRDSTEAQGFFSLLVAFLAWFLWHILREGRSE